MTEASELVARIRLGEDSTLELKRVLLSGSRVAEPKPESVSDELAAMANGRGGTMILGVEDKTREILGIPLQHIDAVELWLRQICNDNIKPPLDAYIRKMEIPNSIGANVAILRVDVDRSLFVHRSSGGYYSRIGSSKREMSSELLARLFQERSQSRVIRFDESTVPRTSIKDLDEDLTRRFTRGAGIADLDTLRKLRIIAEDEEAKLRMTVSGALMCTRQPERWLAHAYIQAVSYAGERIDVNYQNDAQDIVGPLDQQVLEGVKFVRRNMWVGAKKEMARSDAPQFSERAVFEALVNAVAHRDYAMAGARIRLHMFSDRLELYVPGPLANTLTPDSMHLRQYSRNELIVSLLAQCPVGPAGVSDRSTMMERRGDGVPIILAEGRELSGRMPDYSLIDDSELRLVMWAGARG